MIVTVEEDQLEQTPQGIWVIKGETHMNGWIRECGRLDHDRGLIPLAQSHITPGSIAIDVGAFIGDHTIAYLESVGEPGIVVAYEPNPVAFECLRRNCPNALNFQCAVGQEVGTSYIHQESGNVGMSYMASDGLRVNCTTLDTDFKDLLSPMGWRKVSLIKIDVEGCEPEVLRGASSIIRHYRPVIIVEINQKMLKKRGHTNLEIMQFIAEQRYKVEFLPSDYSWESALQCDILLTPE